MVAPGTTPYPEKCAPLPPTRMGLVNVLWASALTFSRTDYLEGIVCTSEDIEHFFFEISPAYFWWRNRFCH